MKGNDPVTISFFLLRASPLGEELFALVCRAMSGKLAGFRLSLPLASVITIKVYYYDEVRQSIQKACLKSP